MEALNTVGKNIPFVDSRQKVTGEALYTTDLKFPGMLFAKILRSPIAHGRILNIDISRAQRLPGVKKVITAKDTPLIPFGTTHKDWFILAPEKVRFIGEEIAAIAAVDEETAEEALELIKVDFEELPAVYDPEEAVSPGAPLINEGYANNIAFHFHVERGNVEEAFAKSDLVLEEYYYTSQVYQAYMEPMAAVVKPEANGRLTFYLPIQIPNKCRLTYAEAMGIPVENIRVIIPFIGGAFGAKMEVPMHVIAGQLAALTGKPVRIVNTREEDIISSNPRVPMKIYLKMGFNKDGQITAKQVKLYARNGGRTCYGVPVTGTACFRVDQLYRFQNVRADGYLVYTNTLPTGCFRGFGNAQMTFCVESMVDQAACALSLDAGEVRKLNSVFAGYVSLHGWKIGSCGLTECVDKAKAAADWDQKKKNKVYGRGIGLACCNHVSGYSAFYPPFHGSAAVMRLNLDGWASLITGETELGQGQRTVCAQIAAEVLGVSVDKINVAPVDSDYSTFALGAFASRTTTVGGKAVELAAQDLRGKILDYASTLTGTPQNSMTINNGSLVNLGDGGLIISLAELARKYQIASNGAYLYGFGSFNPGTDVPDGNKYGNPSCAYPYAAHIAEVEVDVETGMVKVLNYYSAHDLGRAINPMGATGQMEGAVAQGVGWALTEDMLMENGRIQNTNFLDYRIPGLKDMPTIESLLIETDEPNGPFGAKGLGEPALNPVVAAISNAIYDAVGIRLREMPFTPEKILEAIAANKKD